MPIFSNLTTFSLISTVFSLWLTLRLNTEAETYIGYVLILSIGILHGSNDILILGKSLKAKTMSKIKILVYYIGLVVIAGGIFFLLPRLALIFFIAISAFHFGEQHWISSTMAVNWSTKFFFWTYGLVLFGALFWFNPSETKAIILQLTDYEITKTQFGIFTILALIVTIASGFYVTLKGYVKTSLLTELFLLAVFGLIFHVASLLWAFAIYFIFWHSLPSLKDQTILLFGAFNKKGLLGYLRTSWMYWLAALLFLVIAVNFITIEDYLFITLFFAFLAAITVPHVFIMHMVNPKK